MRTPYRTVKGNHPGGGVPQEEYDKVAQFIPASLVYQNIDQDSYNKFRGRGVLYEGMTLDNSAYVNYYLGITKGSSTSSYVVPKIYILRKTAGSDGGITKYSGPQYTDSSTWYVPELYEAFALNKDGELKVYAIFYAQKYVDRKYNGETVGIRDVSNGFTSIDESFIPGIPPSGKDVDAINAKIEELKQSVGYYTYPVLSNGGATSAPNVVRDSDYNLDFTYTLNLF